MELFTIRKGYNHKSREEREAERVGILVVDTTAKGKSLLFAPPWDIVLGHKNGTVSDQEYRDVYLPLMRDSWMQHRASWEEFLRQEGWIAIGCYCKAGCFCHRLILVEIFQKLCEMLNIPFTYYGEYE